MTMSTGTRAQQWPDVDCLAERAQFLAGLRAVAAWYEQHPDMPIPLSPSIVVCGNDTRKQAQRIARALAPCDKDMSTGYLVLQRRFAGVELQFIFSRAAVCTARVLGTREIPERIIPARTEEIVEWECGSVLGDA